VCRKEDRRIGSLQGPLEGQEKAALSRPSCAFSVRCVVCIESGVWLVAMIPPMLDYTAIVGMDALQGFV
jgi:hypothetical protein